MSALLAPFLPYILGAGGLIATLIAVYVKGRLSGAKLEREAKAREELAARDVADQVDADIGTLTPAQQRERLSQWSK